MRRFVLSLVVALAPVAARAQQGTGILDGVVRDSAGKPVGGALVGVAKPVMAILSDSLGRFRLLNLPQDTIEVSVTKASYGAANFAIVVPKNTVVSVAVKLVSAQTLGTVVVSSERLDAGLLKRGYYDRARLGTGKFYDQSWLAQRSYLEIDRVMRDVPLLQVQCTARTGRDCNVLDATGCKMPIWIDGVVHADPGAIDGLIQTQDVKAMEVYRRSTEVPADLQQNGRTRGCGAIVIWTRFTK